MTKINKILISAVGDISFSGILEKNLSSKCMQDVSPLFRASDLTIANLEGPLTDSGFPVAGKCVLRGDPGWARHLSGAGVNILSLANNHMMDFGEEGLDDTIKALKEENILFLGAGGNDKNALEPLVITKKGIKLGLLARTNVIVSSPSYAGKHRPGVAFLDTNETTDAIRQCKKNVDILILLIHWGMEHYHYPLPSQLKMASTFTSAGADLILGHHPHVLQGFQSIGNSLVAYSLGNFIFADKAGSILDKAGNFQQSVLKLNSNNRKGGILQVDLAAKGIVSYQFIPTRSQSNGYVNIEDTQKRKQQFGRLSQHLRWPFYNFLWQLYSVQREWHLRIKPMLVGRITLNNLKKLRPGHIKELWNTIGRSSKIVSEKSTNPYE